jgi:hypothetical protein
MNPSIDISTSVERLGLSTYKPLTHGRLGPRLQTLKQPSGSGHPKPTDSLSLVRGKGLRTPFRREGT